MPQASRCSNLPVIFGVRGQMKQRTHTRLVLWLVIIPTTIISLPFLLVGSLLFLKFILMSIPEPMELFSYIFTSRPDSIWNPGNFMHLVPTSVPFGLWGLWTLWSLAKNYIHNVNYNPENKISTYLGLFAGIFTSIQLMLFSSNIQGLILGWPILAAVYFLVLIQTGTKSIENSNP